MQLLAPVSLHLVEPRLDGDDRIGTQAEHTHPRVIGRALIDHDAGIEQHSQVPAHSRTGYSCRVGNLPRPPRTFAQQLHNVASSWVGQRLEHRSDVVKHTHNISYFSE